MRRAIKKPDLVHQASNSKLRELNMKQNLPHNCEKCTCAHAEYMAGDVVVFTDPNKPNGLMTVHKVVSDGVFLDGNSNFALTHLIRNASVAEVLAKRRFTQTEHALAEVS